MARKIWIVQYAARRPNIPEGGGAERGCSLEVAPAAAAAVIAAGRRWGQRYPVEEGWEVQATVDEIPPGDILAIAWELMEEQA
jgi:hypothetical protein